MFLLNSNLVFIGFITQIGRTYIFDGCVFYRPTDQQFSDLFVFSILVFSISNYILSNKQFISFSIPGPKNVLFKCDFTLNWVVVNISQQ